MLVLLDEVVAECETGAVGHVLVAFGEVVIVDVLVGTGAERAAAGA